VNSNTSREQVQRAAEAIADRLGAHTVILFGSAASGALRLDSDIDLAFLADRTFAAYDIFLVAQQVAELVGREVDLVDFREASTVFQAQIVGTGMVLVDNRPLERQYAYMRALKSYAMLNDERRPVLEKLGYIEGTETHDRQHHHQ